MVTYFLIFIGLLIGLIGLCLAVGCIIAASRENEMPSIEDVEQVLEE
jgi:hypothetical protein